MEELLISTKEIPDTKLPPDEVLWEKWAVHGDENAFFELMDRYKRWIISYAYKKIVNSFAPARAYEESHEFFFWCQSAYQLRRRMFSFKPEKGNKLTTYFSYIIRSCWSIYFKKHLYETIVLKHRRSDGVDTGNETGFKTGILESVPDLAPLPDDQLGHKKIVQNILEAVMKLDPIDAYVFETEHYIALGQRYCDKVTEYIKDVLNKNPAKHAEKVEAFHLGNQMNELHNFMAGVMKITNGALHVRLFRTKKKLKKILSVKQDP